MAKPPPKKKTPPTKSRGVPSSRKPAKKPDTKIPPPCCSCEGQPSGTILVCEDDGWTPIPPPTYFAVLTFDPNRPGGLPYWERPINLGLNCPETPKPVGPPLPWSVGPGDAPQVTESCPDSPAECAAPCAPVCAPVETDAPCPAPVPPVPDAPVDPTTDNTPPAPAPEEAQGAP